MTSDPNRLRHSASLGNANPSPEELSKIKKQVHLLNDRQQELRHFLQAQDLITTSKSDMKNVWKLLNLIAKFKTELSELLNELPK